MKSWNQTAVLSAIALLTAACAGLPETSGYLDRPLTPDTTVDLSWTAPEARGERIEKLVIVAPDSSRIAGQKNLGSIQPNGMAINFARLLEQELTPDFQLIYQSPPDDARLGNPTGDRTVAVLETRLVTVDPGNFWLRALVSCGLGTTKLQIDGRLHVLGDDQSSMQWAARTGSWIPMSAKALLLNDLKELAADTANHLRARLGRANALPAATASSPPENR